MSRLTKKERELMERRFGVAPVRSFTWVGIRPATMDDKKWNKKARRAEGKKMCREF